MLKTKTTATTKRRAEFKKLSKSAKRMTAAETRKVRGGVYQHNQTDLEFLRSQSLADGDPDGTRVIAQKK